MSILKAFKTLIRKNMLVRRLASCMAVIAMVVSLVSPASLVYAEDTNDQRQMEKIESFAGKLVKGASSENGRYVWTADHDADDHRFTFLVDYSMSGVHELEPGAIKIWIPKTILKDRSGKYADYIDLSIPSEDEYKAASANDRKDANYTWKESTDEKHKNCIEVTNVTERPAAEKGFFEVSYITNEQTFEYQDYDPDNFETGKSDPFYADIQVTNTSDGTPQTVTASTDKIPVYINTTAEISSTTKKYPNRLYKEWQSSWGTQPEEAKGKYFLVWQIISDIKEPTQPYTFTLNDTPVSKELHLIGYSMDKEAGPFTDKNYITNQRTDNERYDYVLTYYDPADFKAQDQYKLKNSVKATVTPEDKIDEPTSATSQKIWEWDTPKFTRPPGHFYGLKFGDGSWDHLGEYNQKYEIANTEWWPTYGPYHDYSSYSLDQLQDGKVNSLDTFAYGINVYGFPAPWTVDGNPFNPQDYQKKPVKYELTDEELYLHENIKAENTGADQLKFTIPEDAKKLDADDYQFLSARWQMHSEWRKFDDDEQKFVVDDSGKYSDTDIVHFWAKSKATGTDEYTEVASYNLGTGKAEITNSDVVASLDGKKIVYKDSAAVTGIRFATSNPYWFTNLSATPMVRLKNSKFVMDRIKDKDMIRLYNFSHSDTYDSDGKKLYGLKNYGYDRAIRPKRESELSKHIVSTGSEKVRKKYIIRWKIRQKETLTTDEGTDYLVQKSGKFYDLLPKGLHLQKGSIDIETEKGMLSHSSFSYSVEQDYKGSGRDMLTVNVPGTAKYYNFYFSSEMGWDAIKELGTSIRNPVAYETGNDDICDGRPDDAYGMSDGNRGYMMGLDPKCTTNRFLYDEEPHDVDTITAAVSGLKKQIKDSHDSSYSYSTYTTPNGDYSYKIRFANTMTDTAKNLIFFDSLENYNLNQKHSYWHGILKRFDTSQLKQMGINPVVYVSPTDNLSIDDHHDLTDTSVWQKVTDSTDFSKMHAFAIDCRKAEDGKDFVLNEGEALSAVVYMKAPASVSEEKGQYAKAYNNIYIKGTIMSGSAESSCFIHQDYTEIAYRVAADIAIHKQNADNASESIEGAKYTLKGTSNYGTEVSTEVTTGSQGDAVFECIEKGTYTLKETYSPSDWLLDKTEYTVHVDGSGKITCEKKESGAPADKTEDRKIIMRDSPRIHGDVSFQKLSTVASAPVEGTKFRLSGKSKYGNDVMMYAASNDNGRVKFSDVEYGDYKMKEVETPDGYIPNSKEYNVTVSDAGVAGIDDIETLSDGTKVIRNEPYHTVEISKQSSYDDSMLKGAEFKLTGTSDYGTAYDKTAVSGDNGIAKFTKLESGTYIIQETKAPKDYFIDSTKHIVKVNKNGTYTIDGLKKNDSGKYRQNNKPKGGKIIVYKKWRDNKTNAEREKNPPVIHITTDVNRVPTYAEWRSCYNHFDSIFGYVDSNYKRKIKKVAYADVSADQVPPNAVRLDKNYSDSDARFKIYGWLNDDGTMYYWTNAQTTKLTDSSNGLFYELLNATSIDLSHIDTSSVTNMSHMFEECYELASLNVSNFNTSNVTNMSCMFDRCSSLTSLDVSNFDTSNVTNISGMFYNCSGLTSLTLPSNFDTSKVTNMSDMFENCYGLTSLNVSNFDTSKVMNMEGMFEGCSGLTSLDVSNFDTSKVTDMSYMFGWCSRLTSLDVSNFDTSRVMNMDYMFYDCSGLANIYVSNKWNTDKVTEPGGMFYNCTKLPNFDSSSTGKTHANYGEGGYLTYKAYTATAKTNTTSTSFASRLIAMLMPKLFTPVYASDSASYISTDPDHCKITKGSDTWTYEFSVADDSAKYYTYEDDIDGYTSSVAGSYGITTKDEPLTITNTANDLPEEPKPASLSLFKSVDGKQLVETNKPVEKYSHTANIDDTGKASGTYADSISTNDIVTIPGASKLHVKLYYSTEFTSYDWACVWAGKHTDYTAENNYSSSKLGSLSGKFGGGRSSSMSGATVAEGDIDGDTVTFGFRSDNSGAYYGYYAVVTDAKYFSEKQSDGSVKWYEWSDTEAADIPSAYADKTYMFDVTLKNSDSSKLAGTKAFGDTVFTNGKARVGVKAGEKKTFTDLPGGTTYSVTEDKYDDFYTESENASGLLKAGDSGEAKFTNHYQKPTQPDTPKEYNGFTLKKNVTGFYQNTQNYTFDVSLRKLDPNTEYTLSDGTKFASDADGYGYAQVKLGDKESVKFNGLPVNAQYRITEEGGDWASSYKITNSTSDGDIAQSAGAAEKKTGLSTEWETVDKDEEITVNYTNTVKKYQNLILKKAVTGGDAPGKFRFRVNFTNLHETITSDAGTIVPENDGTASAEVYIGADDQIEFKNVPVTTKYQITELANAGKANYAITTDEPGNAHGVFAKASDGNTEAMKDLSTAEETVNEGENATVTFLNIMPKSASVALTKRVTGLFYGPDRYFRFTVSVANATRNQSYLIDLTKGSDMHDGRKNPQYLKTDENGHATADIWLKHNDTIALKNLPLDAKYSIAEEKTEGYETTIKANGSEVSDISERSVLQPDDIVFINRNGGVLPTGIADHKTEMALACAAIILATCSAFVLFKRKRKQK